ncbi:MAG: GYD domain-containing protein [Reichenbachiella sp.]
MKKLILISFVAFAFGASAQAQETNMKYYLMIGQPDDEAWKMVIEAGGDMAVPARKSIEAMGGELISYWVGVTEAKNYGIVAFPDSKSIAQIVYMRTIQGVMKNIEFKEIMPTDQAAGFFQELNESNENLQLNPGGK